MMIIIVTIMAQWHMMSIMVTILVHGDHHIMVTIMVSMMVSMMVSQEGSCSPW